MCSHLPCAQHAPLQVWNPGTDLRQVKAWRSNLFAIHQDGHLSAPNNWIHLTQFYRLDTRELDNLTQYRFRDLSAASYLCGILDNGEVRCWADALLNSLVNRAIPPAEFRIPNGD